MKGYRFYLEFDDKAAKRHNRPNGNVVAIIPETGRLVHWQGQEPRYEYDCLSAVFFHANSDVNYGGCSREYLEERCKRTSEAIARQVHPRLFERLDYDPDAPYFQPEVLDDEPETATH